MAQRVESQREREGAVPEAESRATAVARELREAIVEGRLQPNERIKQDAVAKRLGVSRLPVREALRELASEGLVTLERDVGARVTSLDPRELLEVYLLREAVEPMMVAQSARKITADELAAAWEVNERQRAVRRERRGDPLSRPRPQVSTGPCWTRRGCRARCRSSRACGGPASATA